jgi:hypothetical protein
MYGYEIQVENNKGFGFRFEIVRAEKGLWYVFTYLLPQNKMIMNCDKRIYGEIPDSFRTSGTAAKAVKEYVKQFNRIK